MIATAREDLVDNAAWAAARPALSVLIPFFGDDPRPLLKAVDAQAVRLGVTIELVTLDDGSGDPALAEGVAAVIQALSTPGRLVRLSLNQGRAKGRNRLARHARSDAFLFLDSDMRPDGEDFLACWLDLAQGGSTPVACGGFKVDGSPQMAATELHRALANRSECLPAAARRRAPAKYVFTNNLLVRREVLEAEPFDEGFVGWGWEDVEWGVRVSRRWPILHIDNPAQNCGLANVETLLRKYQQAAPNFARMLKVHPEMVARFPTFQAARVMKPLPFRRLWLRGLAALAKTSHAPMRLRELAIKSYRAGLYAEAL